MKQINYACVSFFSFNSKIKIIFKSIIFEIFQKMFFYRNKTIFFAEFASQLNVYSFRNIPSGYLEVLHNLIKLKLCTVLPLKAGDIAKFPNQKGNSSTS